MITQQNIALITASINSVIRTNGNNEITGANFNQLLRNIIGVIVPNVAIQNTAPSSEFLWIDTTSIPYDIKYHNGSGWVVIGQPATPIEVVSTGVATLQAPAGKLLEKVIFIPSTDGDVKIGTTAGADDVVPTISATDGVAIVYSLDTYNSQQTTYHITGEATVKFLTR